MTSELKFPYNNERYLQLRVTTYTPNPATPSFWAMCEKRGWRKWLAILQRKSIYEFKEIKETPHVK